MARIYKRTHYADYRAELAESKAMRQGNMEDDFWAEDELVDHRRAPKHKSPRKKGCPGNNNGPHVYIWVEVMWNFRSGYKVSGYESEICCGCEKKGKLRRKNYERN